MTPRLRIVLYVVLALFGVLAANGLYLTSITWLQHARGRVCETHVYQLMFLMHLGMGLLLILPAVGYGLLHIWRARHRWNRRAVKIGYALFTVARVILINGVLLTRVGWRVAVAIGCFVAVIVQWPGGEEESFQVDGVDRTIMLVESK